MKQVHLYCDEHQDTSMPGSKGIYVACQWHSLAVLHWLG